MIDRAGNGSGACLPGVGIHQQHQLAVNRHYFDSTSRLDPSLQPLRRCAGALRVAINPKGLTTLGTMNALKDVEHCEGF